MSSNVGDWVPHARHFVVTCQVQYLHKAVSRCRDPLVKEFLSQCELGDPFEEVSAALLEQSRDKEAGLVEILAQRPPTYDLPSGMSASVQSSFRETLETLIELSHRHEFSDCEAAFRTALGIYLSKAGINDNAAQHLTRAADLYRPFVASEPGIYQVELVSALNSLGITLFQKGLYSASERAYREALVHWEQVDARGAGDNRAEISSVFNNLGNTLKAQRRFAEAEASFRRALDIRRALAQQDKPRYEQLVATTLNNLGNVLSGKRLFKEALAALEEALDIRARLAKQDPQRFTLARVGIISNIATVYQEEREFERARQELELALSLLLEASISNPMLKKDDIPRVRLNLGMTNRMEERWDEAIEHLRQAERAYRDPGEAGRGTNLNALSTALKELACAQLGKGDVPAARTHFREALSLREQLARLDSGHRKDHADCLISYGVLLAAEQENKEAAENFKRAAAFYEALNTEEPGSHDIDLAQALGNLTLALVADGDPAWRTTCEAAIRTAENPAPGLDRLSLSKGRAGGCYSLLARISLEAGDTDRAFRCLAALRCADATVFRSEGGDLGRAAVALRRIEDEVGRKILIVVAHRMSVGSTGSLLGLLQSTPPFFRLVHDEDFSTHAFMLLQEVLSTFETDDTRSFSVRYKAFNRRSFDAWTSAPQFLKDALVANDDVDVLISGDPFWNAFPWDALKTDDGEDRWIGRERVFPRWFDITPSGFSGLKRRTLGEHGGSAAIVCPWNADAQRPLVRARDEAEKLSTIFLRLGYSLLPQGKALIGEQATARALQDLIAAPPTVLHFTGHGTTSGNEQGLILWNDDSTSSMLLSRHSIARAQSGTGQMALALQGGLVVLNSCLSGREKDFGGQREDLPSAFLESGATAVVSSQFPISDVLGAIFGKALYERRDSAKETLSATLSRARALVEKAARTRQSPYWASWALFTYSGNPYVTLSYELGNKRI